MNSKSIHSGTLGSKERVVSALAGITTGTPAAAPLAVHYCARLAGVPLPEYTCNPQRLADCVIHYYRRFQPDAVWLSADTWVTAQAMGAAVAFPGEDQPLGGSGEPLIRSEADLDRIPLANPAVQGRWPLMLSALTRIRRALGQDVFIVACFDQYPFSLACALMGIEEAMISMHTDRTLLERVMDVGCDHAIAYAKALAEAGADMLSGGDSPAGLLSPGDYREIALPSEKRVISEFKAHLKVPVSLHICGNSSAILSDMAQSGADVLELDHRVSIADAANKIGPATAIWGNLDPVGVLAQGSPASVRQATVDLLESVAKCGHSRFVLSSGCTLAVETPSENLDALFSSARDFRW